MSELDELEDVGLNLRADVRDGRARNGKKSIKPKPKWVVQLRAIRGRAEAQNLKAKLAK